MFQKRDKNTPLTVYERKKAMMTNRILCLSVMGLLVYWFIKALTDNEDAPIWFIIAMPLLIIATGVVVIWNFRAVKELDKEIKEEEQNRKDEEEETKALEDKESYAKYLRDKYDIDIEDSEDNTVDDDEK